MGPITFGRLEAASFTHSSIYLALLICAFVLGNPEPETFILGLSHGLMWIGMSLVCLAAARAGIVPFWLAVTVTVIGGLGPFAGTIAFVIVERRRREETDPSTPISSRYS
jgi:ABC-type Fe3+-siderophore transport system permease subunit